MPSESNAPCLYADIRDPDAFPALLGQRKCETVIHLAAEAEAVTPFSDLAEVIETNVVGTVRVLEALEPDRIVFASSSAVYGSVDSGVARPFWPEVRPIGAYGMSKAMAEMVCRDWAREHGGTVINLRFGNVVGAACRGVIPYLVRHARRPADPSATARMRGGGRIMRDYVPVAYAVDVLGAASRLTLDPGTVRTFNVGTGRPMTNREVADIVRAELGRHGLVLDIVFEEELGTGEASRVVLDPTETTTQFGLPVPGRDEVVAAVEEATRSHVDARSGQLR